MKKLILLLVVLITGCAKEPEPINWETLNERDLVLTTKDTNKPYTGAVFILYGDGPTSKGGQKKSELYLKDGKPEGKWIDYYITGQIKRERNYKDGELNGKQTHYNRNGSIEKVEERKDGRTVK